MSYTNDTLPSASSFTNDTKPSDIDSFLLKEDSFYLLLETGDKIILVRGLDYTNDTKPV